MPARLPLLTAEPRRTTVLGIFFSLSIGFYCVELLAFPPMIAKLNSIPTHNWLQTWRGEGYTVCEGGGHNINITTIVIMFLPTHKIYRYISRRNWQTSPQCSVALIMWSLDIFFFAVLHNQSLKFWLFMEAMKMKFHFPVPDRDSLPSSSAPTFQRLYCFPE